MSEKWFLSLDGSAQEGPISSQELMTRIEGHTGTSALLVWRPGLDNWREVLSVAEFVILDTNTPPDLPRPNGIDQVSQPDYGEKLPSTTARADVASMTTSTAAVSLPANFHPWRRFFARTTDLVIWTTTAGFVIGYIIARFAPQLADHFVSLSSNVLVAGASFYLLWIPVEAAFLTIFGATFGKWCFGISVKQQDRGNLDFGTALSRTSLVWLKGDGLGLPLVTLITRIVAYNRLTSTGITSWDEECKTEVLHKEWGIGRAVMCTLLLVALLYSMVVLKIALETPTLN